MVARERARADASEAKLANTEVCLAQANKAHEEENRAHEEEKQTLKKEKDSIEAQLKMETGKVMAVTATWRWEVEFDGGRWTSYDQESQRELTHAFATNSNGMPTLAIGTKTYTVDFRTHTQINVRTHYNRNVRRIDFGGGGFGPVGTRRWCATAQHMGGGVIRRIIHDPGTAADTYDYDMEMFNLAVAQFARLKGSQTKVKVTKAEVFENPLLEEAFAAKKQEFATARKPTDETFVFHGSPEVLAIMKDGFKVGGRDTAVKNGTKHGLGVYTAKGPDTPMVYSQRHGGNSQVILARALPGLSGRQGDGDIWTPEGDCIIFKDSAQLLPVYVVHWQ
jgi:hypothetical protein